MTESKYDAKQMNFPRYRPSLTEPSEVFTSWTTESSALGLQHAGVLRRALPELGRWNDRDLLCGWHLYTWASGTEEQDLPSPEQPERCQDWRMYLMVLTLAPRLRTCLITHDAYLETLDLIRSLKPRTAGAPASRRPRPARPASPTTPSFPDPAPSEDPRDTPQETPDAVGFSGPHAQPSALERVLDLGRAVQTKRSCSGETPQ